MKTIKSLKDITTLEVGDEVVFGNLEYKVRQNPATHRYYLRLCNEDIPNEVIFEYLNLHTGPFIESIGINACTDMDFPEVKSLEALTAVVSALFKEYEKQNELPKTWEEFCKNTPIQKGECLMNAFSEIKETISVGDDRDADEDRTYFTSKSEAKAFLALIQLRQLRKAYVKDWEPDWTNSSDKYCINFRKDRFRITPWEHISQVLSFPTRELAEQFLDNFKDLLEIAKPLL